MALQKLLMSSELARAESVTCKELLVSVLKILKSEDAITEASMLGMLEEFYYGLSKIKTDDPVSLLKAANFLRQFKKVYLSEPVQHMV